MLKKTHRDRGLAVGVTLFVRAGQPSLWENGISQNCLFLLMLLQKSPVVAKIFVVKAGPGGDAQIKAFGADWLCPVMSMAEAMAELDVVIELSAQLDGAWSTAFRARGGKIIGMRVANDFVIDMERIANVCDPGQIVTGTRYDQIWTLPAFARTNAPYYANLFKAPVRVMQHLWSPMLITREQQPWGYVAGSAPWRVAILEPNISSVKTCHIPMLVCEAAYRARPAHLAAVRVFNAMKLKAQAQFVAFAQSLDIVNHGIATFEPRYPTAKVMREYANCIVSHQVDNAQNYLYYEALYGGYPLIHNSALLGDCGYVYRDYDCHDGAMALIEAMATHDRDIDGYRARSSAFLAGLNPCNPDNIASYSAAIAECLDT